MVDKHQLWLIDLLPSLIARRLVGSLTAPSSDCFRGSVLNYQRLWSGLSWSLFEFLVFWLQIAIVPFALFYHSAFNYILAEIKKKKKKKKKKNKFGFGVITFLLDCLRHDVIVDMLNLKFSLKSVKSVQSTYLTQVV